MKHIYRLPPCPKYDLEGMESWLTDMAQEGLLLTEDGFFGGFATFERSEPISMRYRLNAAPSLPTLFNDYDSPCDQEVEISSDMGWKYVCRRGSFYIYRTEDATARELNTDPELQALTIKKLQRQQCQEFCSMLVVYLFYWAIGRFTFGKPGLFLLWSTMGTGFFLFTLVFLVGLLVNRLIPIVHLGRLRRKLKVDGDLEHRKLWRQGFMRYRVGTGIQHLITVLYLVCCCIFLYQNSTDFGEVSLQDFKGNVPFATAGDLTEGDYALDDGLFTSTVKQWGDPLAPVNYNWSECAAITRSDGTSWEGILHVDYHETVSPWLAQQLAEDYYRYIYEEDGVITLPELGMDYTVAISDHGLQHFIFRHESTVIHAHLAQHGEYRLTPEELAEILADSISENVFS